MSIAKPGRIKRAMRNRVAWGANEQGRVPKPQKGGWVIGPAALRVRPIDRVMSIVYGGRGVP